MKFLTIFNIRSSHSTFLTFNIFTIRRLSQSAFFPFDVFSIQCFLLFDLLSHTAFFPFDVLSHSAFFPFDVLSHSALCLSTFCRSAFLTFGVFYFNILSVNRFSLSVGPTGPNQKAYFVKFSLPVNFVVLIRIAYGSITADQNSVIAGSRFNLSKMKVMVRFKLENKKLCLWRPHVPKHTVY